MRGRIKWRRVALAAADAVCVGLALFAAYNLRFEFWLTRIDRNQMLFFMPLLIVVRLALFASFSLYRGILRFAGMGEMLAIVGSTILGTILLMLLNLVPQRIPASGWLAQHIWTIDTASGTFFARIPYGVLVNECIVTILLIAAVRFSRRILVSSVINSLEDEKGIGPLRLLIVGAGAAGEAVVRQMESESKRQWRPVAFVDDDLEKQHLRIHGLPVAGTIAQMPEVIKKYNVREVLIAIPNVPPSRLRSIVELCEHANVQFRILPSMHDVMLGRVSMNQIRPVEIEDLLGREEVTLDLPDDRNYVRDEVVMITGAGGSIGSELCRQLLSLGPRQVLLLGHGENSIYEIAQELNDHGAGSGATAGIIVPVIADIRDLGKVRAVAQQYSPAIFFHAAAHKHVPLMEAHPDEAVKNNITGTRNVATVAIKVKAKRFILISSDKAVRPTNVMGATKRVAEMIVFNMARHAATHFVAVRFGNVLGSRGSVVPLFRRQIAKGGPVTLTHPDVVRFFMTIPEAVSLVIQAGSMGEQRRLYLLDMGQPVRIVDLARNLIRLCGFEPDKDIQIVFTGLRPGEKLKEELLTAGEDVNATDIGKVFSTEPEHVDEELLDEAVADLERLADLHDGDAIRERLRDLVPDYGPAATETEALVR